MSNSMPEDSIHRFAARAQNLSSLEKESSTMKTRIGFILSLLLLLSLGLPSGRKAQARVFGAETLATLHTHDACQLKSENFLPAPITWNPVEVECPICNTKNIFLEWGSYGSYIYQYPSKYELVFWPYTADAAWYSCRKCRLTVFMEEFKTIPKDKIPALREVLKTVNLPPQKERSTEDSKVRPPYLEIPTSARLVVAEKVYRTLGRTDDEFWSHFYRVMGYHFDAEEKKAEADEARRKSLSLTERKLADKASDDVRKEQLYISGAMKHFLRDDASALRDFEAAKKLTYADRNNKPENNKGYDGYLSKLIDEYIEMLHKGAGPRNKSKGSDH
jgi:hypothetical protein